MSLPLINLSKLNIRNSLKNDSGIFQSYKYDPLYSVRKTIHVINIVTGTPMIGLAIQNMKLPLFLRNI